MNTNYTIPTVVVDNFFDDPDSVREMALNMEYPQADASYPGKRSQVLHEVKPEFNNRFINKAMSAFYNLEIEQPYSWYASSAFQLVDEKYIDGWIHCDSTSKATIIVYLNKDANKDSGTSIYRAKDGVGVINNDMKEAFYRGEISRVEMEKYKNENNDQFEEVINIKNAYNRMIMFDGNLWHGANSFMGNGEPRLTLICFIYDLHVNYYPIHRMKLVR